MKPRHPVRLKGFDYVGPHRYSLRFCTDGRQRIFVQADVVDTVWSQILRAANRQSFAVTAYCFMPDHVHLLVEGTGARSNLKRFVAAAKQYSGFAYVEQFNGRLWQRYCFERVLRADEPTAVVVRYILENPLRAGLAANVDEYPFVGSSVYSLSELIDIFQIRQSG